MFAAVLNPYKFYSIHGTHYGLAGKYFLILKSTYFLTSWDLNNFFAHLLYEYIENLQRAHVNTSCAYVNDIYFHQV